MSIKQFIKQKVQTAKETFFDPTNSDFDSNITDVQTALEQISNLDLKTLTEFEAFASAGLESTTSNGWVTKTGYPFTTVTKTAGFYIIDHTVQCGQSDKEKNIGHRVQWRQGTSGTWIDLLDIRDAVGVDNAFQVRTGFNVVELTSDGVFQVRIQFGQTDEGGTGRIKEANIKIGKVSDTL